MDKLLKLMSDNGTLEIPEMSDILGESEREIADKIEEYQKNGILCGYKPIINWDKVNGAGVTALIELKVVPQRETGFDKIAEKIVSYNEVESLYLMAGAYDLAVYVKGASIQEISTFVSRHLATIDEVTSTATHFLLKRYKEMGVDLEDSNNTDIRSMLL